MNFLHQIHNVIFGDFKQVLPLAIWCKIKRLCDLKVTENQDFDYQHRGFMVDDKQML